MSAFVAHVTFDCADPRALSAFWAAVTGYEIDESMVSDDVVRLRSPDKRGLRHLLFYKVPEPKQVKNRVHLDLATADPAGEVARLVGLGATVLYEGAWWTTMADPEGNEFCIG
ncbi:MAG: VOC family protein [Acidimicrobiales bacterium]